MQRGTWLAGLAGAFAIGMGVGRSRFRLASIIYLFFEEPGVARLVTVAESVPGFTVPDANGIKIAEPSPAKTLFPLVCSSRKTMNWYSQSRGQGYVLRRGNSLQIE